MRYALVRQTHECQISGLRRPFRTGLGCPIACLSQCYLTFHGRCVYAIHTGGVLDFTWLKFLIDPRIIGNDSIIVGLGVR
jgi:hypothetical protein